MNKLVKTGETVKLVYSKDVEIIVDVLGIPDTNIKSISKIVPNNAAVLLAEIGTIGMLTLLNAGNSVESRAKYVVVGVGPDTPKTVTLGTTVLLKIRDQYALRSAFDPTNEYSFENLIKTAKEDKTLLAATAIVRNKEISRVGLRIESSFADQETLANLEKYEGNNKLDQVIYRDKEIPFLNYKIIDNQNIDAFIYEQSNVTTE